MSNEQEFPSASKIKLGLQLARIILPMAINMTFGTKHDTQLHTDL